MKNHLTQSSTETPATSRSQFFGPQVVFPKLTVNAPNDRYEQEADAMADRVMRMEQTGTAPATPSFFPASIQRQCADCTEEDKSVQRWPLMRTGGEGGVEASPEMGQQLQRSKGSGRALPEATRNSMGQAFGTDFSGVRVHTGSQAAQMSDSIQAKAFTHGSDIYFNKGQYRPGSSGGDRLLAHELTHVVQQGGTALQRATHSSLPHIQRAAGDMTPHPDRDIPQRREGAPRLVTMQQANEGDDEVFIKVTRYLCNCQGRDITESRVDTRTRPSPGLTYFYCRGRTTVQVTGSVNPSSFSSGSATIGVDVNVAPVGNSPSVRGQMELEGRNTGDEPQIRGRVRGTVQLPNGPAISAAGEASVGTSTGEVDSQASVGIDNNGITFGAEVTNPHDSDRWGVGLTLGGNLPGPRVERRLCRECVCPVVYRCYRYVPVRAYEEQVTQTIYETSPLRYYFRLNSASDTTNGTLRQSSQQMLQTVADRVANGAVITSIRGYASPEFMSMAIPAGEQANADLSLLRAQRLRALLGSRLDAGIELPEAEAGGELFGNRPTILPGSDLAQASVDAGFSGPEEVSTLLVGPEIENDQLSGQFLGLFDRVTEPDDRLRLFGIDAASAIAPELLVAIQQFVAAGGRGRTPWRRVFQYLRFATVELTEAREVTTTEQRRTDGEVRRLQGRNCDFQAQQAEDNNLFGPAEVQPDRSECSLGQPRNREGYDAECDYS